jgi:predicted RNA-binding protein
LGGILEITGSRDAPDPDTFDRLYPYQLTFSLKKELVPPLEFKPFVPRLSFLTNKHYWGAALQGKSALRLPRGDARILISGISGSYK